MITVYKPNTLLIYERGRVQGRYSISPRSTFRIMFITAEVIFLKRTTHMSTPYFITAVADCCHCLMIIDIADS